MWEEPGETPNMREENMQTFYKRLDVKAEVLFSLRASALTNCATIQPCCLL